jgi:nitrobindin-like protein
MNSDPAIHAGVASLAGLVGTWSGGGSGRYPTMQPFDYLETVSISHIGKPFLSYHQRTQHADTGQPLHTESGFWRMGGPDHVELLIAQPTGLVEVLEGTVEYGTIRLRSSLVGRTSSAKDVTLVERDFTIAEDVLSYSLRMTAVGCDLTDHLEAELRRVQ